MPRPRFVEASTPAVRDALGRIVDIVLANGGTLRPDLVIREDLGSLSVHVRGASDSERESAPLFDVPRELLVPIDGALWADDPAELRMLAQPSGLTSVQRDLLELHVALYNAAGKIPWLMANHPRAALLGQDAILAALRALRPGFADPGQPPAETFLSTRVFDLSPDGDEQPGAAQGNVQPVLLPLMDALNHHPEGARFDVDARSMVIVDARPVGTDECFAHYGGRRDVLDVALKYGFVDLATRRARSAPMSVELPVVGRIDVLGERRRPAHPLDPPVITTTDEGIALSHLIFDARYPERFHSALGMAVRGLALSRGVAPDQIDGIVRAAVEGIEEANLALIARLIDAAQRALVNAAALMVGEAAARQAQIITQVVSDPS